MFTITSEDGNARAGELKLPKCKLKIKTPFWMPVGTKGCVKNISPEELSETGIECIIANSLLLSLRPGSKVVEDHGGIHKYMRWNKGIFTDSGGFQIGSESFKPKISDKGFEYKDPFNGIKKILTPEKAMREQSKIGADVIMALDQMPVYSNDKKYVSEAVRRTHEWILRCIKEKQNIEENENKPQLLFGIAQGGFFRELRELSARYINKQNVDGIALGGLAIGESKQEMNSAVDNQLPFISKDKIRYMMGLGSPKDILDMIGKGIDCFDSVFPTQSARRGTLYAINENSGIEKLNIQSSKYLNDYNPIEEGCKCYTCRNFTRSYVCHMLKVHENFGFRLATIHNIYFMQKLISEARNAIEKGNFNEFKKRREG